MPASVIKRNVCLRGGCFAPGENPLLPVRRLASELKCWPIGDVEIGEEAADGGNGDDADDDFETGGDLLDFHWEWMSFD